METKDLGKSGEDLAVNFLKKKGYKILERNWRTPLTGLEQIRQKEIDIIAKKDGVIVFIEVKTLIMKNEDKNRFLAEESVGPEKRKNLIFASKSYLFSKRIPEDTPWQIDVISVEIGPENVPEIHHFKNEIY